VAQCGACVLAPPPLDACFAAVDYAYPWSGLLGQFKFGGEPGLAAVLAAQLHATAGVAEVLAVFQKHGFAQAAEVGEIVEPVAGGIRLQVS